MGVRVGGDQGAWVVVTFSWKIASILSLFSSIVRPLLLAIFGLAWRSNFVVWDITRLSARNCLLALIIWRIEITQAEPYAQPRWIDRGPQILFFKIYKFSNIGVLILIEFVNRAQVIHQKSCTTKAPSISQNPRKTPPPSLLPLSLPLSPRRHV